MQKNETWVGYYHHPLFQYRRHENNLTNTLNQNLSRFHEERALYLNLAKDLKNKGLLKLAHQAHQMKVLKLNLGFQMLKSILAFRFKAFKNEAKLMLELFT